MSVQMRAFSGSAIIDWSRRRLVLSFYEGGRTLIEQIEGVYTNDTTGPFFAFVRDGRFTESLLGKSVQVELAERLRDGRAVIATGSLAIGASSLGVTSFGQIIGNVDARFTFYFDTVGLIKLIEQDLLAFPGQPVTPAPIFDTRAGIQSDGTPQGGETLTGVDPTGNGPIVARRWLLNGVIVSETQTYTIPVGATGTLRYEADLKGPDGTVETDWSTTAVITPITITGTPPASGMQGQPYVFRPGTAGGAGNKTFALSGVLVAGLSFSPRTGAITGTPTLPGTMTGLTVTVTDDTGSASTTATTVTIAAITLAALSGTDALINGTASSGTITGKTAGSTLTTTVPGLTITGTSYTFDGTGAAGSYTITETLAGATNNPRVTTVVVQEAGGTWGGPGTWGGGGSWGGGTGGTPVQNFAFGTRVGNPSEDAGAVQAFAFGTRNGDPGEGTPAVQNFAFGTPTTTPSE
jgi:hypothetical protein